MFWKEEEWQKASNGINLPRVTTNKAQECTHSDDTCKWQDTISILESTADQHQLVQVDWHKAQISAASDKWPVKPMLNLRPWRRLASITLPIPCDNGSYALDKNNESQFKPLPAVKPNSTNL